MAAVVAAGCGKPSTPANNAGVPGAGVSRDAFAPEPPPPVVVVTPAQEAGSYERQLAGQDATTRQQAAQALRGLGEDGYAALLRTIRRGAPEAKQEALRALDAGMLKTHANELLPVLSELLRDRNPVVRVMAVSRIGMLGKAAADAVPDLRRLSKSDEDAQVRGTAEQAVVAIDFAVTGSLPASMLPKVKP
jgi:hypothetical protein